MGLAGVKQWQQLIGQFGSCPPLHLGSSHLPLRGGCACEGGVGCGSSSPEVAGLLPHLHPEVSCGSRCFGSVAGVRRVPGHLSSLPGFQL